MAEDISTLIAEVKGKGIQSTTNDLNKFTQAAEKAEVATKRLGTAQAQANAGNSTGTANAAAMAGAINALTAAVEKLGTVQVRAAAATRQHNAAMSEAQSLSRGLAGSLGALWVTYGNLAGMATGLAIGAALKGVVTSGADVEHTLETIRVLGESSTQSIKDMKDEILTLGKSSQGPKEVAEALSVLTLAGLNAEEALRGVGASLSLATAGGIGIEKSASTLVQVSTALGYTADAFDHIGDVVAKTAAVSMSSVDSISGAFKSAASVGELYGASLTDIGLGLASVANLGIQGTAAGTALKNMYKDLASGSEKVTATLAAMGLKISDLKDADGSFIPLIDATKKLEEGLQRVNDRQTALGNLFGERGVKPAAALIKMLSTVSEAFDENGKRYASKLDEIQDRIVKSYGFATQAAIAMSQTSTNQFKSVGNTLQTSLIKAFDEIAPKVGDISRGLKEAFASPEFINGLKTIVGTIGDLLVWLTKNTDAVVAMVAAFAAFKALQMAASFAAVATSSAAAAGGIMASANAARVFQAALGPIGIAITALTTLWVLYKAKKDAALDIGGINNLKEAVDKLQEFDDKLRKNAELRSQNKTEAEITAAAAAQAEVNALNKVTQAAAENTETLKANWKIREDGLNMLQRAALKAAEATGEGGGGGGVYGQSLLKEKNDVLQAISKQVVLTGQLEKLRTSTLELAKQEAIAVDKAAKANELRITGETELAKKKTGTGQAEALNAQIGEIRNAYSEITNEYRIYLDDSKTLAATGESDLRTQLNLRNQARAEYLVKAQESYEKELAVAAKYQGKTAAQTASHYATMKTSADKFLLDIQNATKKEQSRDENSTTIKEVKDQDKLLKAIETTGNAEQKRLQAVLLADQQRLAGIGNMKSERAELEAQRSQDEYNEIQGNLATLNSETEIGLLNGTVSKAQAERSRAAIVQGQAQLALRKKHIDYLMEEVTAYKKVEAADRTTKNLNNSLEAAKRFQKSLTDAFGAVGDAIGGVGTAFEQMFVDRDKAQRKFQDASKEDIATGKARKELDDDTFTANIRGYSNMAESAKGFLNQRTAAYKIADGISKALHIAEVARSAASIAVNVAAGAAKMFAQSGWGGFAGVAAMAAVMVGLGFAVSGGGGGGGQTAAEAQATQGTGSVFGDSSAKTDSINKSLDLVKENTGVLIPINSAMLESLRAIQASMVGLTNLVIRTNGLTGGTNMGIKTGVVASGETGLLGSAVGLTSSLASAIPLVGGLINGVIGKISSLFGKTTQTIVDSGIQFSGAVKNLQSGQGFNQYANVDTTKKSWFGLSKSTSSRVETQGLSDELSQQFGLIFTNLEDVLKAAAPSLGKSSEEVGKAVENFVLPLSKVSLKDLKGDELTAAINGVVSKALDDIAKAAFPGYEKFAQVGEGYSETLIRVATDVASVQQVFTLLGKTLSSSTANVADIAESLITAAGGLEKLQNATKAFTDAFYTDAEKLAPLQTALTQRLTEYGVSTSITTEQFKKLVLSQDLTTTAGQSMYLKLLEIAPAFDSIAKAAQKLFETSLKVVDDAMKGLNSSVDKVKSEVDAAFEADKKALTARQALEDKAASTAHTAALKAISAKEKAQKEADAAAYQGLKDATTAQMAVVKDRVDASQKLLDSIKTSLAATSAYDAADAHAKALNTVRNASKSSNTAGYAGIDEAIKELAKPTEQLFSSAVEYQQSQAVANNALRGLATATTSQLTDAQKQLTALTSLKEAIEKANDEATKALEDNTQLLEDAENARYEAEQAKLDARHQSEQDNLQLRHDKQIEVLNNILNDAQRQIDLLTGIDTTIKSLPDALQVFATAVAAAGVAGAANGVNGGVNNATTSAQAQSTFLEGLYSTVLGRASDVDGKKYWTDALNSGFSQTEVMNDFLNSDEYKALHPSLDVGTNEVPGDMLANIHKGERIIPAADNAELMRRISTSEESEKTSKEQTLDGKMDELIDAVKRGDIANVNKTHEMFRILRDWDTNGMPPVRTP